MESKKLTLIINPISGVRSKEGLAEMLSSKLTAMGCNVDCRLTQAPLHATQLAREAVAGGAEIVAVCGGDGTINEAALGMVGTGVPLALIPSGSGNGLARHLGIPVDECMAADVIAKGRTMMCDCGQANDKKFFCTFGTGFDADVAHRFAAEDKRGLSTYVKDVIAEFRDHKPRTYNITIDGRTIRRQAFLIACCNASQYGNNAFIAPDASIADGVLDIVVMHSGNALRMLHAGFDLMAGMVGHNRHIEVLKASHAVIEMEHDAYAHIDGEPITTPRRIEVDCLPSQLMVCVPAPEHRITPFITPIELTMRQWSIALSRIFHQRRN